VAELSLLRSLAKKEPSVGRLFRAAIQSDVWCHVAGFFARLDLGAERAELWLP